MPYAAQQMVIDFHKQCKLSIGDPTNPDITTDQELRLNLIQEELEELQEALANDDVIKTADALGDILYTVIGAATSWGIDIGPIFEEIHRSNMTKKPGNMRSDGKILKDADYQAPEIKKMMNQSAREFAKHWKSEEPEDWAWPKPELEEPRYEVTEKIMEKAREYVHPFGDHRNNWEGNVQMMTYAKWALEQPDDFEDEEPTNPDHKIRGQLTKYGAYVFQCECGRTHAVSFKLGSRGGMADTATEECICGKAFIVHFNSGDPSVEITTIEELRKAPRGEGT